MDKGGLGEPLEDIAGTATSGGGSPVLIRRTAVRTCGTEVRCARTLLLLLNRCNFSRFDDRRRPDAPPESEARTTESTFSESKFLFYTLYGIYSQIFYSVAVVVTVSTSLINAYND